MGADTFEDKQLICKEPGCGAEFTITAKDLKYFSEKEFPAPKRCKPCRRKRRAIYRKQRKKMIKAMVAVEETVKVEIRGAVPVTVSVVTEHVKIMIIDVKEIVNGVAEEAEGKKKKKKSAGGRAAGRIQKEATV